MKVTSSSTDSFYNFICPFLYTFSFVWNALKIWRSHGLSHSQTSFKFLSKYFAVCHNLNFFLGTSIVLKSLLCRADSPWHLADIFKCFSFMWFILVTTLLIISDVVVSVLLKSVFTVLEEIRFIRDYTIVMLLVKRKWGDREGSLGRWPGYVMYTDVIFRWAEVFVLAEVCLPRRPHAGQPRSDSDWGWPARLIITFVDMTFPMGWTWILALCPFIFYCACLPS